MARKACKAADVAACRRINARIEAMGAFTPRWAWDDGMKVWAEMDQARPWASLAAAVKHFDAGIENLLYPAGSTLDVELEYAPKVLALRRALDWTEQAAASIKEWASPYTPSVAVLSTRRWLRPIVSRWGWEDLIDGGFPVIAGRLDDYWERFEIPYRRALVTLSDCPDAPCDTDADALAEHYRRQGIRPVAPMTSAKAGALVRATAAAREWAPAVGRIRPIIRTAEYPRWCSHGEAPREPGIQILAVDRVGDERAIARRFSATWTLISFPRRERERARRYYLTKGPLPGRQIGISAEAESLSDHEPEAAVADPPPGASVEADRTHPPEPEQDWIVGSITELVTAFGKSKTYGSKFLKTQAKKGNIRLKVVGDQYWVIVHDTGRHVAVKAELAKLRSRAKSNSV